MTDHSPDRIPTPLRRSCVAALRACANEAGRLPTSAAYSQWLAGLEPLLLLRAYVADHGGEIPTASALDNWLATSDRAATAARWSSAKIERAYGSLRRALASASRLGPIVADSPEGQWLPSPHTIVSTYGSWRAALVDAGLINERP